MTRKASYLENLGAYPEIQHLEQISREKTRVESILTSLYGNTDGQAIADEVFELALQIDEIVNQIKDHSAVKEQFNYENGFTSLDGTEGINLVDGLDFLRRLDEINLNGFKGRHSSLMKFLKKDLDEAQFRQTLLQKTGTISVRAGVSRAVNKYRSEEMNRYLQNLEEEMKRDE